MNTAPPPNNLRRLRRERGWSQQDLASKAGLAVRTVYAIERGAATRMGTRHKILRAFGFDITTPNRIAVFGS